MSYDKESKSFILKNADYKRRFRAIKKEDNQFVFQLADGEYLSASDDNTVTIRENPWNWETFTVEDAPDQKYYLRSFHGNYLRVNYDTHKLDLSPYRENWEAIEFIKEEGQKLVDGNWYSIKADKNMWVSYDNESKGFILNSADFKSRFRAIKKEDNQFVFQLAAGEFLSASEDNTVTIRENPWGWETFTIQDAPNQKYYLQSIHGNYLRVNYNNHILDLSPNRENWEAIEFNKEVLPVSPGEKLKSYIDVENAFDRIKITSLHQQGYTGKGILIGIDDDGVNCQIPEILCGELYNG